MGEFSGNRIVCTNANEPVSVDQKGGTLILYSYWWLRNFVDKRAFEEFSDMRCVTTKSTLKQIKIYHVLPFGNHRAKFHGTLSNSHTQI